MTILDIVSFTHTHIPAGQREPRTWAEECRGTAPSAPSSPVQSGVSTAEERKSFGYIA